MTIRAGLGAAVVVIGVVLVVLVPDGRLFWFEGRPFGLLLMLLGAVDVLQQWRRRSHRG